MKKISFAGLILIAGFIAGCNGNDQEFDASGLYGDRKSVV